MGQVFLGFSPGGRPVAVKLIHSALAADAEFRQRFKREAEAVSRVGGVYTAPVVDADPDAPFPYLVTTYVAGPSLAAVLTQRGPLPVASVRRLGAGLAEALEAIHAVGVIHRDLKPSNILLAHDGPRVIDFGIARAVDATGITMRAGTAGYMAPELIRGGAVTPACDMFSLGAVLARAAGVHPFGEGSIEALTYRVVHQAPQLDGLDVSLRPLVAACLAGDPTDRPAVADALAVLTVGGVGGWPPPTVIDLIDAYRPPTPYSDAALVPSAPPLAHEPTPSGLRRRSVLLGGLAATTAAIPTTAFLLTRRPEHGTGGRATPTAGRATPTAGSSAATRPSTRTSPALAATLKGHRAMVWSLAISPDGRLLASGSGFGSDFCEVRLWDVNRRSFIASLPHDPRTVETVAFSPNGRLLASGTWGDSHSVRGNEIRLWDVATRRLVATMPGHTELVRSVDFSPDGRLLASASSDNTIRLWDVTNRLANRHSRRR